jgi:hypothetical protein
LLNFLWILLFILCGSSTNSHKMFNTLDLWT